MKKRASIFQRKGTLFVAASHRTTAGFWIGDDQVVALRGATPGELGFAVESALRCSRDQVPTPPPTARVDTSLLKAAAVSSWATFMKMSKHVSVSVDDGAMKVTLYRNLGAREGYEPQETLSLKASLQGSALGELILEALDQAS